MAHVDDAVDEEGHGAVEHSQGEQHAQGLRGGGGAGEGGPAAGRGGGHRRGGRSMVSLGGAAAIVVTSSSGVCVSDGSRVSCLFLIV